MKLQKLEEVLTDYRCPGCGARMSSGIPHPEGDYDDWLIKPHCIECDFEPEGSKNPFKECVPDESESPEPLGAVLFEYTAPPQYYNGPSRRCQRVLLCRVSRLDQEHQALHWGFGGNMYKDPKFTPLFDFACAWLPGETQRDFEIRAELEAKAFVSRYDLVEKGESND